ncbi:hypothetical protein [Halostella sp. PRR32]|uniref:hypothetical protein n=1 Tax=Halostella sp. PRR32 TaxID=3098147 RepID=UPI002B1E2742|nr:hypothetical protein [Halostella sp. PRR32]
MTQPTDLEDRLRNGDQTLVRLPVLGKLTINEFHVSILGVTAGLILAWSPIARRTIRREPWYAAAALLCGYWLGRRSR